MSNLIKALRIMRPERPPENPWATAYAAEILESEGHYEAAAEVRNELGPPPGLTDPLDILIFLEEHGTPDN